MTQGLIRVGAVVTFLLFLGACDRGFLVSGNPDDMPVRSYISRIGEKEIQFGFTDAEISKFPSWSPKQTPPILLSQVIEIAEKELPKITHGTSGWYVKGVSIEQIRRSSDGNDKWIYLVNFGGAGDRDYVQLPVTFLGEPVKGVERSLSREHR